MKKVAAIALSAALALGLASCSTVQASQDGGNDGSVASSEQPAQPEAPEVEPEPAAVEPESVEAPVYDPIELECDNPLADADIASVEFRLYGVGAQELTGADLDSFLSVARSDARVFETYYEGNSNVFESVDLGDFCAPPRFVIVLESGEQLVCKACFEEITSESSFFLNDCSYELGNDEYETLAELYDTHLNQMLDESEDSLAPYEDLTSKQIDRIVRFGSSSLELEVVETELTDEQVEQVVGTLNALVIEPKGARFNLDTLYGGGDGGYADFELWFKDGSHYTIGSYADVAYDESSFQITDRFYYAYIDGVLLPCSQESMSDLSWDYYETDPDYVPQYLNARDVPEYPFEDLTADEIGYATIRDSMGQTQAMAPHHLADEIVDVLRQIRYCDDNEVTAEGGSMVDLSSSDKTLYPGLTNGEYVMIGIDGDDAIINFGRYTQEPEVAAAIEDLFEDIEAAYQELLDSCGETYEVAVRGADTASDYDPVTGTYTPFVEYTYFELPSILAEHDDGYYPDGYTLDNAPLSVQIYSHDLGRGDESLSFVTRLKNDMEAADGVGYFKTDVYSSGSKPLVMHWGEGGEDSEFATAAGYLTYVEIYIKGSDDYEVKPEAVLALVLDTIHTENVYE